MQPIKVRLSDRESATIAEATGTCEIHCWQATPDMPARLVELLRNRHGNGGANVCRDCLTKAHGIAARNAGKAPR